MVFDGLRISAPIMKRSQNSNIFDIIKNENPNSLIIECKANSDEKLIYDDDVFNGYRINAPEMKRSEAFTNALTTKQAAIVNEHVDYWTELLNSDDFNDDYII